MRNHSNIARFDKVIAKINGAVFCITVYIDIFFYL